jgi:cytoskeletal protein RodZ
VGQFGDKFRKAREKKNISLDDVSNVTKISARMLQAIEEERFDQLPGGVFNKGFIRAYAKHIGLNDEEAVNEYLACLRQAQIDAQAVWEPNAGAGKRPQVAAHQIAANQVVAGKVSHGSRRSGGLAQTDSEIDELPGLQLPRVEHVRPPRREFSRKENALPWRPVVIAILLVFAAVVVWQRYERHARAAGAGTPALPVSQSSQPVPTAMAEPTASRPTHSAAPQLQNARGSEKASQTENRSTIAPAKKTVSSAANAGNVAEDDSTSAPGTPSAAPVPIIEARFTLVIHADENSWISVTADGQPVSHETLIAPADASIRANRQIVARIGNAAGVSFVWNGQQFQPQGAEAEVKTFIFDENGMHEAAGQNASQSRGIP